MKLTKEDIKQYATKEELQEMAKFKKPFDQIFLVFSSGAYIESFEDTFLGSFTDGEIAYQAAAEWSRKRSHRAYEIYQTTANIGLSTGQAEDVTQDLEDLYGEVDEDETI
jgi:hypothetical protein